MERRKKLQEGKGIKVRRVEGKQESKSETEGERRQTLCEGEGAREKGQGTKERNKRREGVERKEQRRDKVERGLMDTREETGKSRDKGKESRGRLGGEVRNRRREVTQMAAKKR